MLVQAQVSLALYLSLYNFYLSQTKGQSVLSSPATLETFFAIYMVKSLDLKRCFLVKGRMFVD